MAGKTGPLAVQAFLRPLQRAISCVTREVVTVSPGGYQPGDIHAAVLARGDAVRLRDCDLALAASLIYEVTLHEEDDGRGPWKVSTRAYIYTIFGPHDAELITYHWQPEGPGPPWPHMHVGTAALDRNCALDRHKHIPTGRVALEDAISLAIEMGAVAIRDDYDEVLSETRGAFHRWRTWA